MNEFDLIAEAMRGVRVVVCERCNGLGVIGLPTLPANCPVCGGSGETTTNDLEVSSETES